MPNPAYEIGEGLGSGSKFIARVVADSLTVFLEKLANALPLGVDARIKSGHDESRVCQLV